MSAQGGPRCHLLPLQSGGSLLLSAHPASWPGLTPGQVLDHYHAQGVGALVSLVTASELVQLGLTDLPALCQARGLVFWHAPIADREAPDAVFERWWQAHCPALLSLLAQGQTLALHCWGGLGRTGTVAARLLMLRERVPAVVAIDRVRQARPGSIETAAQTDYLLNLPPANAA